MADPVEIKKYILFTLNDLLVENAHHKFEMMCLELTKQNIMENVIPSTGPVARLGDKGRDFLNFRTYLNSTLKENSIFFGVSNQGGRVVFACSIQKKILGKIKFDVNKIIEFGLSVESIFFFSRENIKVAETLNLERWVEKEHNVHLEILDGNALADLLALKKNHWIAQRFLNIPQFFFGTDKETQKTITSVDRNIYFPIIFNIANIVKERNEIFEEKDYNNLKSEILKEMQFIENFNSQDLRERHILPEHWLMSKKIAIVDLEASGLRPDTDLILDIGIVELDLVTGDRRIIFDSRVREATFGDDHRNSWIFKNSDLRFEYIENAPSFDDIKDTIQNIFNKYYVTAYNKSFDLGFLKCRGIKFPNELPCIMLRASNICKIPFKMNSLEDDKKYKWPHFSEVWDHFFPDNNYSGENRAVDDARDEAFILFQMYKNGLYP